MIKVLLADDQDMVREGLAMILSRHEDITVVGQARDGFMAVELVRELDPDVVLMDVRMPGMDGVEATQIITADDFSNDPNRVVRVLVLTTYRADENVHAALRVGASGFALKDRAPADLLQAIRAVAGGDVWLDPSVAKSVVERFRSTPTLELSAEKRLQALTPREIDVLILLSYGFSNQEIADHLVLGEATIKTHVSRILMKLDLRDRTQAVVLAYQSGLVQPGRHPPPAGRTR